MIIEHVYKTTRTPIFFCIDKDKEVVIDFLSYEKASKWALNHNGIKVWLRERETSTPLATIAYTNRNEEKQYRIAVSKCNPTDTFNKRLGRTKAIGRLNRKTIYMGRAYWEIMNFLVYCSPQTIPIEWDIKSVISDLKQKLIYPESNRKVKYEF